MRIVAHNGARIWGGAERATVILLRGLADRGHEVMLLCNTEVVAKNAIAKGVPAQVCVIGGDIAVHHSLRVARALKRIKPDVFIIGTFKKLFLASLGARFAHIPKTIARIGLETDTPRSWKYRVALKRWVDEVVVNARRMTAPFEGLPGFDAKKVHVIWNGVRAPQPKREPGAVRKELGISTEQFVIGTVSRLAKQKRIDRLIDVVAALPDVQCIVAGDGTRRKSLEEYMYRRNVQERMHFLGDRNDTADVLDALDVFVLTSGTEGLSNAMLEAMSRGLPVVSTPVSGADDALTGDSAGDAAGIVADFSAESIAAAIARLKSNPATRLRLGESARARAEKLFSLDQMLDAWERVLMQPVT